MKKIIELLLVIIYIVLIILTIQGIHYCTLFLIIYSFFYSLYYMIFSYLIFPQNKISDQIMKLTIPSGILLGINIMFLLSCFFYFSFIFFSISLLCCLAVISIFLMYKNTKLNLKSYFIWNIVRICTFLIISLFVFFYISASRSL